MDIRAGSLHATYGHKSRQPPRYKDLRADSHYAILTLRAYSLYAIRTLRADSLHARESENRHPQCYTDVGEGRLRALWNQIRPTVRKIDVGVNSLDDL
jgi:hypothetical protein